MSKYAFSCKTCGTLEDSDNAGERDVPAACRTCGAGVTFDPVTGIKQYQPENWLVLDDLSDAELEALPQVLLRDDVVRHTPAPATDPGREPQNLVRAVDEDLAREEQLA